MDNCGAPLRQRLHHPSHSHGPEPAPRPIGSCRMLHGPGRPVGRLQACASE